MIESNAKIQAKIDKGWTDEKIKNYREDGAPIPPLVERLNALAVLVCEEPEAAPSGGASDQAWRDATGQASPEDAKKLFDGFADQILSWRKATGRNMPDLAADMIAGLAAKAQETGEVLSSLRNGAAWLIRGASAISGLTFGSELSALAGEERKIVAFTAPVSPEARARDVAEGPGATFQDAREGHAAPPAPAAVPAPPERKVWTFKNGLVLVNIANPAHRVLFSNTKGTWIVQTITATGDLGPDTAAHEGQWFTDTWSEGPAYVAPKKGDQMVVPGSGPTPGAAPAAKPMTIGDWNPDDKVVAGFVTSFGTKMAANDPPMAVDEALVRRLIEKFKAEKGAEPNQKPGVSFFHYGMAALRG